MLQGHIIDVSTYNKYKGDGQWVTCMKRAFSYTSAIYYQWAQKVFKKPSTFSYLKVFLL